MALKWWGKFANWIGAGDLEDDDEDSYLEDEEADSRRSGRDSRTQRSEKSSRDDREGRYSRYDDEEDRYDREDRYSSRNDRYDSRNDRSNRDERYDSRNDRADRTDRYADKNDRYDRTDRSEKNDRYGSSARNTADRDSEPRSTYTPNSARRTTDKPAATPQDGQAAMGGMKMIVYHPVSYEDTQNIIDSVKNRKPVIVNMDDLEMETAQRVLDFLSGAIYALNGSLNKVSNGIFIAAPNNYDIVGNNEDSGTAFDR